MQNTNDYTADLAEANNIMKQITAHVEGSKSLIKVLTPKTN